MNISISKVVIYHGSCYDGMAALWVMKQKYPDIEAIEGNYSDSLNDVINKLSGKDVFLVDFSYKHNDMCRIRNTANSVTVYDHHKTAEAELQNIEGIRCVFDMGRSGAGITWDEEFPEVERPLWISYVEDRDIWNWKLPHSREINACIMSYPLNDKLFDLVENMEFETMLKEGDVIERYNSKLEDRLAESAFELEVDGFKVPAIYCTVKEIMSGTLAKLARGKPFSVGIIPMPDKGIEVYSLRSDENGEDVSIIAANHGGGGHKHAAGFKVSESRSRSITNETV